MIEREGDATAPDAERELKTPEPGPRRRRGDSGADALPDDGSVVGQNSTEVEVDDSTVMSVRRTAEVDESTQIASRRMGEVDDHTEIASRRKNEVDESTQIASRRKNVVDDRTEIASRRKGEVDDSTSVSSRRKSRSNTSDSGAAIPTLSLAGRRTTRITDDTGPLVRYAAAPDQAILKAPYRPRQQQPAPDIVHLAPNAPTRPPRPLEESIQLISRQRSAARRRLTLMTTAGTGTMLLSAGGIIALWMLG